jgi:hypothetical protein
VLLMRPQAFNSSHIQSAVSWYQWADLTRTKAWMLSWVWSQQS